MLSTARVPPILRAVALIFIPLAVFCACSKKTNPLVPEPETPHGAVVMGAVRDAVGAGVAGAIVTLEAAQGPVPARVRRLLRMSASADWRPSSRQGTVPTSAGSPSDSLRVAVTGANGGFAFAGVPSGDHVITGTARDHLAGRGGDGGPGGGRGGSGSGGGGQGGPGGPSWCIALLGGASPSIVTPVYSPRIGGASGLGGRLGGTGPRADAGPTGPSGAFGP